MRVRHDLLGLFATAIACALCGCGAATTNKPEARTARSEPLDAALELASALPAGAERCAIARPSLVPAPQRGLARRVVQSLPNAWDPGLEVVALASADQSQRQGGNAQLTLVRSTLAPALLRERIDAQLTLVWSDNDEGPSCSDGPCPLRARVAVHDEHGTTLRFERGRFEPRPQSITQRCVRMARDTRAVEVVAMRLVDDASFGERLGLPLESTAIAHMTERGLSIERIERMAGEVEAEARAQSLRLSTIEGGELHVEQLEGSVRTRIVQHWDDLALLERDEARQGAAQRVARARLHERAPELDAEPAGMTPEDYLARGAYELLQMRDLSSQERSIARAALRALFERAHGEHPEHEVIAQLVLELRMSEPELLAGALELAERFAALPGADPRWAEKAENIRMQLEASKRARP